MLYTTLGIVVTVGAILGIYLNIKNLLKMGAATEINVVWYAFSLVLVIRAGIDLAAYFYGDATAGHFIQRTTSIPLAYTLTLHTWLTDVKDELQLIAGIILVAIVPQLVTYFLAGLSGCARSPPFIWQFEQFAAWSLIKFLAALAGISLEESLLSKVLLQPESSAPLGLEGSVVYQCAHALGLLAIAFMLASFQTLAAAIESGKATGLRFPRIQRLHGWLTRNLPKEPSSESVFDSASVERNLRQMADSIRNNR